MARPHRAGGGLWRPAPWQVPRASRSDKNVFAALFQVCSSVFSSNFFNRLLAPEIGIASSVSVAQAGPRGAAMMNWQQELLEQASAAAKAAKPKPAGKVRLDASATHARRAWCPLPGSSASAPVAIPRALFPRASPTASLRSAPDPRPARARVPPPSTRTRRATRRRELPRPSPSPWELEGPEGRRPEGRNTS